MTTADKTAVVLVVEDDHLLRLAAVDMLEDAGFSAVAASNADDAVLILEQRTDITLVFTDIDMPGSMDGMKLAAAVRDRWPPIHIIVTSGHRRPDMTVLPGDSRFFSKPYSDQAVVAVMRQMMS